jgi:hypothetical protein
MDHNSQNYSALKTPVPPGSKLPQIVVQMPVYKESLEGVRRFILSHCLVNSLGICLLGPGLS